MSSHRAFWRRQFSPLDVMLLALPAAFMLRFVASWRNDTALFITAGLSIIPLAGWMGRATEQLAERAGPGIGGLLNATFGNAAELIIALIALNRGYVEVVKASITGSIVGNILLVLGAAILVGGSKFPIQRFNATAARGGATLLSLAAMGLMTPTIFHTAANRSTQGWSAIAEQNLSMAIAVVLFVTYVAWLVFSLITHKALFAGAALPSSDESAPEDHEPVWSVRKSLLVLGAATGLVAWLSELLVASIDAARVSLGLSEVFVGVIVVAIIGNAAEHSTAILLARKNKMDLSLGIAIGSSLQIALFVTPILVFASYAFGHPINLEFTLPELAAVVMAVWTVVVISGDGESNWLEGVQLLSVYLIVALLFYFLPA